MGYRKVGYFEQLLYILQWKIKDFPIDMAVLEDAPVEMESLFFKLWNIEGI